MRAEELAHIADDGAALFLRRWTPERAPRAVVQIAHGLAEHSGRYARLAGALVAEGYAVYAHDHRGHGHTAPPGDLGFFADRAGWGKCVGDIASLTRRIKMEHAGLPVALLGHSMGSFMAQDYVARHGDMLSALVLSGSNGAPPAIAAAGRLIARVERLRLGPRGRSPLLKKLMFGDFNKPFKPARTDFDWLSRDAAEVDKYIADPLCGFDFSTQLAIDLLDALGELLGPERLACIPRSLPVYVFSGARDPVGANIAGLIETLRAAGLNVSSRLYPEGRHEMLNETNRAEVTADLIAFLDRALARSHA